MNRSFIVSLALCAMLIVPAASVAQTAAAPNELPWFINLLKVNNGKAFCIPANAKMVDIGNVVAQYAKAHPDIGDHLTDGQTIGALREVYPCSVPAAPAPGPLVTASQSSDLSANIGRLLSAAALQQTLINSARLSAVMVNNPCADAQYKLDSTIGIFKPMEFNTAGELTAGAWKQPVREQGCGTSHLLNVLAVAKGDKQIVTQAVLPGNTHADPLLQRDALTTALAVVGVAVGEPNDACKTQYVSETEFVGEEGQAREGAKHAPWREIWTVVSCTKRSTVPILFIPDSTGTSFSVGPQNAVRSAPLG